MRSVIRFFVGLAILLTISSTVKAQFPRFKVLAFYSTQVETSHVEFANDAIKFFKALTEGNGFVFDTTSNMADLNTARIKDYQLLVWINDFPHNEAQREAFRDYMENGGGWLGFHVAAYNDRDTNWPWFVKFLGGAVFYNNNWPPMPVKLIVDDTLHSVTKGLPRTFIAPINEWYQWKPNPRENKKVKVLVTLSPENYPLGLKDIITSGDIPVVWTNTGYRMIYLNMGHGPHIFTDATQNKLIIAALRWVVATDKKGNPFER
ncbi:MAG TPA: ThuA domain-containing protein [Puia sp.]|nr:ThuA domain-containing protein [Puia sp.]